MRLKTPRAPEPPAPHWQMVAMTVVYVAGSVGLVGAFVGNFVLRAVL